MAMSFTFEGFCILILTGCVIVFNILILLVYFQTEIMFTCLNKYFFVSLTISDLCFGLFILPFSFWTSVFDNWVFGATFCHLEAYLATILWIVSIYSLMWLSIDFYMAIRKGDRYESVMSPVKAKCWIAFVWMAATFYCCPPLFGVARARYYPEAYLCIIDWKLQRAYLLTSAILIIIPPLVALTVSNCYIFTKDYKENSLYWEKVSEYTSRPDAYVRNFVIGIVFIVAWLPWCCVQLHELIHGGQDLIVPSGVHFFTIWLAIGNSAWKFFVYLLLDGDFRKGLTNLYKRYTCSCVSYSRFYGKSIPFPEAIAFQHPYVDLLTVEQALADYAVLLTDLKQQLNATGPVIAFGGSYGGMLTAYMRFKYPNIIQGGIAASAPIYLVSGKIDRSFFFTDVTKDFQKEGCDDQVRQGFIELNSLADTGIQGYKAISKIFNLCSPILNRTGYRHLLLWLRNSFTNLAMLDYPYPTHLFVSLPGNPVKVACDCIRKAGTPPKGLKEVTDLYYGSKSCHNIWEEFVECSDPTGCGTGPSSKAWDYQACTELAMPAGSNNVTDMFPVLSFTLKERQQYCTSKWQTSSRNSWINTQLWGTNIGSSSNIVFSNGDLDPWHRGGVLNNVSNTLVSVLIKGGAHHLDLRGSNPEDPQSVISARELEVNHIQKWIQQFYRGK